MEFYLSFMWLYIGWDTIVHDHVSPLLWDFFSPCMSTAIRTSYSLLDITAEDRFPAQLYSHHSNPAEESQGKTQGKRSVSLLQDKTGPQGPVQSCYPVRFSSLIITYGWDKNMELFPWRYRKPVVLRHNVERKMC